MMNFPLDEKARMRAMKGDGCLICMRPMSECLCPERCGGHWCYPRHICGK